MYLVRWVIDPINLEDAVQMITLDPEIEAKYEVLGKMGEGGMGSVYKVRHRILRVIRVIKTAKYSDAEADKQRFIEEAQRGSELSHGSIARVLHFDVTTQGTAYIVMEFIDGQNVRQVLSNSGKAMAVPRVIDIALQTLGALQYLHEHGFVHRDISPDNLMLTTDDDGEPHVKLIDLGIAKSMAVSHGLTGAGNFIGKFNYASPEQVGGRAEPRSDLYSLGVVMYELLTGVLPVSSNDYMAVIMAHLSGELRSFDETDPEGRVPVNLRQAVMRALAPAPENRFQKASEFAATLRSLGEMRVDQTERVEIPKKDVEAIRARRSEQIAYEAAKAADSPKEWDTFLNRYPQSSWAPEAEARLEELNRIEETDWNDASKSANKAGWQRFLDKHPDSGRASQARRRLEKIETEEIERRAWDAAVADDSVAGWESFLGLFGASARAGAGRERLAAARDREAEERAWIAASRADTVSAWSDYIAKHPQSGRLVEAKQQLAAVTEREAEDKEWFAAIRANSIEKWEGFVERYPQSSRRDEALEQLSALRGRAEEERAFASAVDEGTSDGWRVYLRGHEDSPRVSEARRYLSDAEQREIEVRDWIRAIEQNTVAGWTEYQTKHPTERVAEARERLAAAKQLADEAEAWAIADRAGSSAAWKAYLDQFGDMHRGQPAREQLVAADRREREKRDWDTALNLETVAGWNDFLAAHSASPYAADARKKLGEARDRESEQQAFAESERIDSFESWSDFVRRYPGSSRLAVAEERRARAQERREAEQREEESRREAQRREEEARRDAQRREEEARRVAAEQKAWDSARSADSVAVWKAFLTEWPSGAHSSEARKNLEAAQAVIARDSALRAGTPEALEDFLKAHGKSPLAAEVRQRLDVLRAEQLRIEKEVAERARQDAERARAEAARKAKEAAERARQEDERARAEAVRRAAEEQAWNSSIKANTIPGFEAFIKAYPQSERASEAHTRIGSIQKREREAALAAEERAWTAAVKRNSVPQFEEFLAAYQQSAHAADARRRIEETLKKEREAAAAAIERAWSAAVKRNTIAEFEKFRSAYPESKHAAEVDSRIQEIKTRERDAALAARTKEETRARAAEEEAARKARAAKEDLEKKARAADEEAARKARARKEAEDRAAEARTRAAQKAAKALATEAATAKARATAEASEAKKRTSAATSDAAAEPGIRRPVAIRAGIAAAVLIAAAIGIGIYLHKPEPAVVDQSTTSPVPSTSGTTVTSPVVPPTTGLMVINAFPWGEVTSIKDDATKTEHVPEGAKLITPVTMPLPPGSYKVVLSSPNSGKSTNCSATVEATKSVPCEATLDTVDANDYLNKLSESRQ